MLLATNFCEETKNAWKIVGTLLAIVKIVVPLLIIITGIIPFINVVTSGKADDMFAAAKKLFFKIIAALIVFLVPTVIPEVIDLVSGQDTEANMEICVTCMKTPGDCDSTSAYDSDEVEEDEENTIEGDLDTGQLNDSSETTTNDDD